MQARRRFSAITLATVYFCLAALFAPFGSGIALANAPQSMPQAVTLPGVDDFEDTLQVGVDGNNVPVGFFTAQDGGTTVSFTRTASLPAPLPGSTPPNNALKSTFSVTSYGVVIHNFTNVTANAWVSQDWSAYAGISFWLYGNNSNTDLFLDIIDNRTVGSTKDDAERFSIGFKDNFSGWKQFQFSFDSFSRKEIGNGAPNDGFTLTEVYGWALGSLTTASPQTYYMDNVAVYGIAPVRPATFSFTANEFNATEGQLGRVNVKLSKALTTTTTVDYQLMEGGTATSFNDYNPVSGTLTFAPGVLQQTFTVPTLHDTNYENDESILFRLANPTPGDVQLGTPSVARLNILDNESYDPALVDDFESYPYQFKTNGQANLSVTQVKANTTQAIPGQDASESVLLSEGGTNAYSFGRRFPIAENWSSYKGLNFWYYGQNTGKSVQLDLLNNNTVQTPDWQLAWSDEFNANAGTPPNPAFWTPEIGDGTVNGNVGWGNSELEYYTNSTENAAHDGAGNLVITVKKTEPNSGLQCYYGPCKYTSARLLSWHKVEVAYGKVEARIKIPRGAGLWPAFWALGTDIDRVNWPQTGEIDIMENVGRLPKRVFGTLHGPGYSGGNAFGRTYDFANDVADDYHTFSVEWQPNKIVWFVDGIQYHQATPADVAPNQWVYNHPFFLLLNVAVGGNFGGEVGSDTVFPQQMKVDYVRVYKQEATTTTPFRASFTDNFSGWKQVYLPFGSFRRAYSREEFSTLNVANIAGYNFNIPAGYQKPVMLDRVRLSKANCSDNIVVTSVADSGSGSLRDALNQVCDYGQITFSQALANATIKLTSGELVISKNLTLDASSIFGVTISGEDTQRVFAVSAKQNVTLRNLTITKGYGWELAGGILNNGSLLLDKVTLVNNRVATSGADFWKGGGAIYVGERGALTLRDSTVRANQTTGADSGGIYSYFNTLLTIENSTINGNISSGVGGGLRTLGDVEIVNSTLSGNTANGWHGGAIFHTDGIMRLLNTTVTGNSSPADTAGGIFVGTFTAGSPTLTLTNSIVAGNQGSQCFVGRMGTGSVTLGTAGHNLASDGSCSADIINANPKLNTLSDNGGSTQTHALLLGSPAIDAGQSNLCPPADQRGVKRLYGTSCDLGAYELILRQ